MDGLFDQTSEQPAIYKSLCVRVAVSNIKTEFKAGKNEAVS